nr:DUF4880 domain-containing protein [Pseudoxanthomonas sp.]
MSAPHESSSPQEQAIAWYVRLHSGAPMQASEQARFLAWLDDPAHQAAWEDTLDLSEQLEQPARMLARERDGVPPRAPVDVTHGSAPWWLAGALALTCAGIYLFLR